MTVAGDPSQTLRQKGWSEGVYGALVAVLVLAGTTLAAILVVRREMWLDEYHTWLLATMSLPSLWTFVTGDVHPPLYFALMNGWQRLTGDAQLALRLPSLLAYAASVVVFATAVRQARSPVFVRTVAVALFAWSPALVYYGSEARMYALAVLLAAAALACVVQLHDTTMSSRQQVRLATALALLAVGLVYTHYTGLFLVCGIGAAWLLRCLTRRAPWPPFVRFALIAGVGIALWLPVLIEQRSRKTEIDRQHRTAVAATSTSTAPPTGVHAASPSPLSSPAALRRWAKSLGMNTASIMGVYPGSGLVMTVLLALPFLLLLVGVTLALHARDELALSLLCILAASAAGTLVVPLSRRYLLVAAPALFLLLWRSLNALYSRRPAFVLAGCGAALVSLAGCLRVAIAPEAQPLARIAAIIRADTTGAPVHVLSNYAAIPLRYHLRRERARAVQGIPVDIEAWWASQPFKGWATVPISRDSTEAWLDAHAAPAFWLVQLESEFQDPWGYVADGLDRRYLRTEFAADALEGTAWRLQKLTARPHVLP